MLKRLFKIVRNIFISIILIYSLNIILQPLNINIPVNVINVSLLTILGFPVLISLIIILLVIY